MKKNKTPSNKKAKRVLASIGMAALLFTGGVAASSFVDAGAQPHSGTIKAIQQNANSIMKDNNLLVDSNFDYIDELNKTFADKEFAISGPFIGNSSINEGELKKAVENKDYFAWQVALRQNFEDSNEVPSINQKEFELLSELRKNQANNESE